MKSQIRQEYVTGTGQHLVVHNKLECSATKDPSKWCVIHKRLPGHMAAWPTHWRGDWGGFMEVICPHGVGHPAPEQDLTKNALGVHGCDGCCRNQVPLSPPPMELA